MNTLLHYFTLKACKELPCSAQSCFQVLLLNAAPTPSMHQQLYQSNPNTRLPLSLNTWQLQGCCFLLKASYPDLRLLSLLQLLSRSRESDAKLALDNIFTCPLGFRCFVTWATLRQLMYLLKPFWGKGNTHWDYSYNFTCFWFTLCFSLFYWRLRRLGGLFNVFGLLFH